MTQVDPGGEVIALDAAGYGAVTITKSVNIIANPGFYAGITASSAHSPSRMMPFSSTTRTRMLPLCRAGAGSPRAPGERESWCHEVLADA